ncbi:hypothetical protein FOZ61_010894, partial [Perkinsus olseni]
MWWLLLRLLFSEPVHKYVAEKNWANRGGSMMPGKEDFVHQLEQAILMMSSGPGKKPTTTNSRSDDDEVDDGIVRLRHCINSAYRVVSTLYDHHHVLLSSSTSSAATGNNIGSSIEDYWKHRDYIINNTEKMVLDAIGYDTSSYTDNAATLLQVVINYASSSSAFYSSSSSYPCIVSTAILLCDEIIVNNILYNNIYSNNIIHNADNSRHNSNKYRVWVIALAAVHLAVVATSAAANSNNAKYNNNIKDKHDDDDKGRKDNNAIPLHIQRALDDLQGGKESVDVDDDGGVNLSFSSLSSSRPALRHLKVGKILLPDTALLEHFNDKNYSPSHHQQEHGDVTQRHEGDDDDDDDDELKALQLGDLAATLLDTSDMGGDKEIELHHVNRPDVTKMLPYNPQEDQVLSGGVGLVSSSSSSSTTAYGRQAADDHHHHHHRNPKNGKNGSVDEDDMMMMIPMIIQTVLQVLPKRDLMTSNYQSVAEECAKTMKAIPILRKVDDDILIDIDRTTRQNAEYRLAKKDQPDAVKGKSSSAAEQQGSAAAAAMTAAAVTAASQALGEATAAVAGGADHRHPSVVVKKEEP